LSPVMIRSGRAAAARSEHGIVVGIAAGRFRQRRRVDDFCQQTHLRQHQPGIGIDTDVRLSGLLRPGKSHVLVEQVRAGTLTLVSSPALLAELAEVVARPKFKNVLAQSK
jgi:hypothetical protein